MLRFPGRYCKGNAAGKIRSDDAGRKTAIALDGEEMFVYPPGRFRAGHVAP